MDSTNSLLTSNQTKKAEKKQGVSCKHLTKAQHRLLKKQLEEIKLGQASLNHLLTMLDWRITMVNEFIRKAYK